MCENSFMESRKMGRDVRKRIDRKEEGTVAGGASPRRGTGLRKGSVRLRELKEQIVRTQTPVKGCPDLLPVHRDI